MSVLDLLTLANRFFRKLNLSKKEVYNFLCGSRYNNAFSKWLERLFRLATHALDNLFNDENIKIGTLFGIIMIVMIFKKNGNKKIIPLVEHLRNLYKNICFF